MRKGCALGGQEVTTDDTEIVSALRARLADRVGWKRFELWFNNCRLRLGQETLCVAVPSTFFQDWLRNHFRGDLEASCEEVLGRRLVVTFEVDPALAEQQAEGSGQQAVGSLGATGSSSASASRQPDSAVSTGGQAARGTHHPPATRPRLTFEQIVVGPSNKVACTSAHLVAEQPGKISPLVVYGSTGLGKTHLLEAILSAARQRHGGLHAVYLTAEQFTTYFLEALGGKGLPSFRRKYRGVDLLLVDDVHFIAGKKATQLELLHTIDTLLKQGKQLVFAADRPPSELAGLGPELSTRLGAGLVCRVEQPDFDTRLGIVAQLCVRLNLKFPGEVQRLVATHVMGSAREISGALHRLHATSLVLDRPLSVEAAEDALVELTSAGHRMVCLPDIQRAVCHVFNLEPECLQSTRKAQTVSYPRMLAMFLARKHTRAPLSEIGQFFGRRSHSTVISANKKVAAWMSERRAERKWNVEDALRKVEERLKAG